MKLDITFLGNVHEHDVENYQECVVKQFELLLQNQDRYNFIAYCFEVNVKDPKIKRMIELFIEEKAKEYIPNIPKEKK